RALARPSVLALPGGDLRRLWRLYRPPFLPAGALGRVRSLRTSAAGRTAQDAARLRRGGGSPVRPAFGAGGPACPGRPGERRRGPRMGRLDAPVGGGPGPGERSLRSFEPGGRHGPGALAGRRRTGSAPPGAFPQRRRCGGRGSAGQGCPGCCPLTAADKMKPAAPGGAARHDNLRGDLPLRLSGIVRSRGRGRARGSRGGPARGLVQVPDAVADHRGELAARVEAGGALVGGASLVSLARLLVRGAEEEAGVLRGLRPARVLEEGLERSDRLGEVLGLGQRVAEPEVDDVVFRLRLERDVAAQLLRGGTPVAAAEGGVSAIQGGLGNAALHARGPVVDRLGLERGDELPVQVDGLAHGLVQAGAFLLGPEEIVDVSGLRACVAAGDLAGAEL